MLVPLMGDCVARALPAAEQPTVHVDTLVSGQMTAMTTEFYMPIYFEAP